MKRRGSRQALSTESLDEAITAGGPFWTCRRPILAAGRSVLAEAAAVARAGRRIAQNLDDGLQVELVSVAIEAQRPATVEGIPAPAVEAATALRARIDALAAELRGLVYPVMPAPSSNAASGRPPRTFVAVAADATELLDETRRRAPDLVVTDIRMPPGHADDGLRAALEIRACLPEVGIVVLSQHLQRRYAVELLAGAPTGVGYLLKQRIADISTLCHDLQRVCAGDTVLDPEVAELMLTRARSQHQTLERLTDRQLQVLGLMAEGRSDAFIARQLVISEKASSGTSLTSMKSSTSRSAATTTAGLLPLSAT